MNPVEIVNIVVIGGGVVGTAITAEISRHYDDVFLLEAAPRLGMATSTRNSGVIHAGIYYKPGSLKAFHCIRGVPMLYEFCAAHNIPHERTGKLIVADSEDPEHLLPRRRRTARGWRRAPRASGRAEPADRRRGRCRWRRTSHRGGSRAPLARATA